MHAINGIGKLLGDIEAKAGKKMEYARFGLLLDEYPKGFILNTTAFANIGEKKWEFLKTLKAGALIWFEGKLSENEYEKDGKKVKTFNMILSNFGFATPRAKENGEKKDAPKNGKSEKSENKDEAPADSGSLAGDDEIPF